MTILAVDADRFSRKQLNRLLKKALPDAEIAVFSVAADALPFAQENVVDVAFIDLGGMHLPGYFLAKQMLAIQKTNIIFTNYEFDYLQYALELRVSGYIRKPLRYNDVLDELNNLRYPVVQADGLGSPANSMAI